MRQPKPITCFAHHHMTPSEFALWNYARAVTWDSHVLFMDGRTIASLFQEWSKSNVYKAFNRGFANGWYKELKPKRRNKQGCWNSGEYRPLSFEEWAAEYPDKITNCTICQSLIGTGTSPLNGQDQSPKQGSPVPQNASPVPLGDISIKCEVLRSKSNINLHPPTPLEDGGQNTKSLTSSQEEKERAIRELKMQFNAYLKEMVDDTEESLKFAKRKSDKLRDSDSADFNEKRAAGDSVSLLQRKLDSLVSHVNLVFTPDQESRLYEAVLALNWGTTDNWTAGHFAPGVITQLSDRPQGWKDLRAPAPVFVKEFCNAVDLIIHTEEFVKMKDEWIQSLQEDCSHGAPIAQVQMAGANG